ncbi:MAG: MFS transporter [Solirubrobacterales bacterium]|nr:MAG: MFS transporter [Solirubrobacterales bacterium]
MTQAAGVDRLDRRGMTVLSLGHLMADSCQGAVPALLPFLVSSRGYSLAQASALVLAATVSSSVIQPIFGHLSDRRARSWLMPLGIVAAGVGIALTGVMPSYPLTFAVVVLSGLGVAAFHPEGSRSASYVSGARRATGMSLFSVGGNIGFAVGPALVTPLVLVFGLTGTLALAVLPAAMGLVVWRELARLGSFRPEALSARAREDAEPDQWGPFARLAGAVACRSVLYFGLLTFVPLWFVRELHTSKTIGNAALTVMLISGALGTLVGGRLADRVGRRVVLLGSMALAVPLVAGFLAAGVVPAFVLVGLAGGVIIATFSVTVVMGQELLPGRIGVASGVTLGLSIGVGGVGASVLGVIADHAGLSLALHLVLVFAALAALLTLSLPVEPRRRVGRDAATVVT